MNNSTSDIRNHIHSFDIGSTIFLQRSVFGVTLHAANNEIIFPICSELAHWRTTPKV